MKNRSTQKPLLISQSRWLAYTIASIATATEGVNSAEAEIHYSGPVTLPLSGFHTISHVFLPLSPGISAVFLREATSRNAVDLARFTGKFSTAAVRSQAGDPYLADKLSAGERISQGAFFINTYRALVSVGGGGNFVDHGVGYLGFRFNVGKGKQYGWVRIRTVKAGGRSNQLLIVDYAWGDPGDEILAGQKSEAPEPANAIPHSGSLGALAFGSAALLSWRQHRSPNEHGTLAAVLPITHHQ